MIRRMCTCVVLGTLSVLVGCATKCGQEVTPKAGQVKVFDLGDGVKLEMVWIEPGSFTMGSPTEEEGRESNETPHLVTLAKGYWLGKYEVTQGQWEQVMGSKPLEYRGKDWPVVDVSWDDCNEFIQKLNAKLSSEGGGFRLPSEAQLEYACRAGSTTKYCFGDDESRLGEYAWFIVNSQCMEHPVGGKKPNAWGLHDMHGNVWEWCEDRYGEKPPVEDPRGPSSAPARVWRGGSWTVRPGLCRSAFRDGGDPSFGGCDFGFRVVLE